MGRITGDASLFGNRESMGLLKLEIAPRQAATLYGAAGFDNQATEERRRASVELKNIKYAWTQETNVALEYPFRDLALQGINAPGFDKKCDMWRTAKNKAISEPLPDRRQQIPVRKRHTKLKDLNAKWLDAFSPMPADVRQCPRNWNP